MENQNRPNRPSLKKILQKPEAPKALYEHLVMIGQIPPEKRLPEDQINQFFGIKEKEDLEAKDFVENLIKKSKN